MQLQKSASKRWWQRFLPGLLTAFIIAILAGGAWAYLGADLFKSLVLANASSVDSPGSPLAFDTPKWSMIRHKYFEGEAARAPGHVRVEGNTETVVLDDWTYTAITRGRPQPPPSPGGTARNRK